MRVNAEINDRCVSLCEGPEILLACFGHQQEARVRVDDYSRGGNGGDIARVKAYRAACLRAVVCVVTSWGLDVVSRGQSGDVTVHSHRAKPHNETPSKNA